MKTISRRICGVVLGLFVLGSIVPGAGADEMADRMAEQRRQNDENDRQWQQWQQWREEQQRAQDAQDKYYAERDAQAKADREWQESRGEWAAWFEHLRQQQEWNDWLARSGGWSASDSTTAQASAVRPAGVVILNPFALEKMAPADQEKVRQQATQSGQQIQTEQQIVLNPFVRAAK